MSNAIGTIPDIPKLYTALAEWLAVMLYVSIYRKEGRIGKLLGSSAVILAALMILQTLIGKTGGLLWLAGMLLALCLMYFLLAYNCKFSQLTAAYTLMRAFILAEFAAALEWQIAFFCAHYYGWNAAWQQMIFLAGIYAAVFGLMYFLEKRHADKNQEKFEARKSEVTSITVMAAAIFGLSNLSYVYAVTPFSSTIATEVFNIRTLIDFGGVCLLYAYHLQQSELQIQREYAAIQTILNTQYAQYRQSKENMEFINRKYHDMKHQILVLKQETDSEKRMEYLDEMERDIKEYEAQNKTGNAVLDTVLTAKSTYCLQHDITLTCVADGTLLNGIYVMDICTMFGNALDNAIECELQNPEKDKRLIHLSVSAMNQFTLIRVENYFEGELKLKNGLPATTKGDSVNHGLGLKSIRYTAEKLGGTMTVSKEDNWFVLKILLPNAQ